VNSPAERPSEKARSLSAYVTNIFCPAWDIGAGKTSLMFFAEPLAHVGPAFLFL
jgi:hypothetical protein